MRVNRLRQYARDVTGPEGHAHRLLHICTDTDSVEEVCEDVKLPLRPLRPGRHNQPVIPVEKRFQLLDSPHKSLCSCLCWRHHRHLVPDHGVNHHIEYHWVQRVVLLYPTVSLEGRGVKHPPAFSAIRNQVQYIRNIRSVQDTMPYPYRMLRHRSHSGALYVF